MLLKIKYLIQGYFNWIMSIFKELRNQKLYSTRYNICKECKYNKNGICTICGCVIKAKTKSNSRCPKKFW